MKTILALILGLSLLTSQASANKYTKDMLEQVSSVNGSWRPVVGSCIYSVRFNEQNFTILRLYNINKIKDLDPEYTDAQAVFLNMGNKVKLIAITFSPITIAPNNIELLVPKED